MQYRISRWRYGWAYSLILALALCATWLTDRARDSASWFVAIVALSLLVYFEIRVRSERVIVRKGSAEYVQGFFTKHTTHIGDVRATLHQRWYQTILRYGTVSLRGSHKDITVTGVDEARKLCKDISK